MCEKRHVDLFPAILLKKFLNREIRPAPAQQRCAPAEFEELELRIRDCQHCLSPWSMGMGAIVAHASASARKSLIFARPKLISRNSDLNFVEGRSTAALSNGRVPEPRAPNRGARNDSGCWSRTIRAVSPAGLLQVAHVTSGDDP